MAVGFTAVARHGNAEFHLRDHGLEDRPPLVTQAAILGLRIVLMGRLYYWTACNAPRWGISPMPSLLPLHRTLSLLVWLTRQRGGLDRQEGVDRVACGGMSERACNGYCQ